MKAYDVIIIGAGPAGLICAKTLALAGKEVLVLEKNDVIGPKICAGGLTTKDLKIGIPALMGTNFNKVVINTPHQKRGYRREFFDSHNNR